MDYFKSAFTVDNVIFGFDEGDLKVLLILRGEDPYPDKWALPGYFVRESEDLDAAAYRVLEELTGMKDVFLEQVSTFGNPQRHPMGRVITVAYYSLVRIQDYCIRPASMAREVKWYSLDDHPSLAFDHGNILQACFERLKKQVRQRPLGFELLPSKFTLTELQHLYEAILGKRLDKRNFRKKILAMSLLVDVGETQAGVAHRPAKLYQFDQNKYDRFVAEGFDFQI